MEALTSNDILINQGNKNNDKQIRYLPDTILFNMPTFLFFRAVLTTDYIALPD